MRVLLAPHGTRGDIQPMVALAVALRARGHAACFSAPSSFLAWIRACGFDAVSNGVDIEAEMQAPDARLDSVRWMFGRLRDHTARMFEPVARASEGADVDRRRRRAAGDVVDRRVARRAARHLRVLPVRDAVGRARRRRRSGRRRCRRGSTGCCGRSVRPLADLALRGDDQSRPCDARPSGRSSPALAHLRQPRHHRRRSRPRAARRRMDRPASLARTR